jgi:pyridoxal phosphate enzyme (YggS family)
MLAEAIGLGLTDLGENVVQDAAGQRRALGELAGTVRWHMIGHLQTNKVRAALEIFDMVQSVDSLRVGAELSRRASRRLPVLLEVNVAGEASKYGFSPREVAGALAHLSALPNLSVEGLMTVAPVVEDAEQVRPVFRELRAIAGANGLRELSMGMTGDFEIAIEEGATIVRVGRALFGERNQ